MFYDIESKEYVSKEQLKTEYDQRKEELPDEYNYSFEKYIENSLTINNGTLEIIVW